MCFQGVVFRDRTERVERESMFRGGRGHSFQTMEEEGKICRCMAFRGLAPGSTEVLLRALSLAKMARLVWQKNELRHGGEERRARERESERAKTLACRNSRTSAIGLSLALGAIRPRTLHFHSPFALVPVLDDTCNAVARRSSSHIYIEYSTHSRTLPTTDRERHHNRASSLSHQAFSQKVSGLNKHRKASQSTTTFRTKRAIDHERQKKQRQPVSELSEHVFSARHKPLENSPCACTCAWMWLAIHQHTSIDQYVLVRSQIPAQLDLSLKLKLFIRQRFWRAARTCVFVSIHFRFRPAYLPTQEKSVVKNNYGVRPSFSREENRDAQCSTSLVSAVNWDHDTRVRDAGFFHLSLSLSLSPSLSLSLCIQTLYATCKKSALNHVGLEICTTDPDQLWRPPEVHPRVTPRPLASKTSLWYQNQTIAPFAQDIIMRVVFSSTGQAIASGQAIRDEATWMILRVALYLRVRTDHRKLLKL
ncbi:uncharacterized protein MYCFIDRAFT_209158 [Pseudocercospora fijiensis CIRAD86]|uniref:Uncharacterized protein n=1 Tax=Pseudocercospora fijiensis (strain CIRAD86) TaxID=383855 RepID=M2ZZW5_PSEFD|nr:uncharacterized protein MYCFIDRAFT_209158 [Pseudocercospora fijiensis CIRAD86]EME77696.1 hypothetical protein MYCFIDRAFT_209158 [Pseudocercospora fijiensis CIRAD86]